MSRKLALLCIFGLLAVSAVAYAQDEAETAEMEAADDSVETEVADPELDEEAEIDWTEEVPEMTEEEVDAAVGDAADGETLSADWYARVKALKNKSRSGEEEYEVDDYHMLKNWNKTAAVGTLMAKFNASKLLNETAALKSAANKTLVSAAAAKNASWTAATAALAKNKTAWTATVPAKNWTAIKG